LGLFFVWRLKSKNMFFGKFPAKTKFSKFNKVGVKN
jgi:hypothetical protein